jgi:hypothetical protein
MLALAATVAALGLQAAGVMAEPRRRLPAAVPPLPVGEVDGVLTVPQIHTYMAALHAALPDLVTPPVVFGATGLGNEMNAYCIGACVGSPAAPALLLTGLHHAREPVSMMVCACAVCRRGALPPADSQSALQQS